MSEEIKNEIESGVLITVEEYFKNHPLSIHIINNNLDRKGVMINGLIIEIGSVEWENIRKQYIYVDKLFGEIRSINY